jgi:hypothetical protein
MTAADGVIGGILAGAVVAGWFLVVDLVTGQPFQTPRLLAGTILGHEPTLNTARLVAIYTLVHFSAFAALGLGAVWVMRATGETPRVMTGTLFGVAALTAVHYGGLLLLGARVLTVLSPWHILAANLLGGVVMMLYVHRVTKDGHAFGPGTLRHHPLIAQGMIVGAIGAGTVALWFLLLDAVEGRPFYTPAALGSALLLSAQSPAGVRMTAGVIAAYTFMHLLAFLAAGVVMVWVARQLERAPGLWLVAFLAVILFEALFIGVVGSLAMWVLGAIGLWAVMVGNVLAVVAMAYRVWATRPELRERFTRLAAEARA